MTESSSVLTGESSGGRYPRRALPHKNYKEPSVPDEDTLIYCDSCHDFVEGGCNIHKMIHVKDTPVPIDKDDKLRALKTVPEGLMVGVSSIPGAGDGVWTIKTIKKDTLFGPYEGVYKKKSSLNNYSWEVRITDRMIMFHEIS
ncbi:histone-lysine N-methyltransferase PRDM7 [Bemisia tabaci]|uniref:histone-lysine N-methyltransferase PRDM7 n=1 Tax=Bemisia tabaci TaxID=7038 RepID=UPI003B28525D